MPELPYTAATDPAVLRATRGLVDYLHELVRTAGRTVRDCERYAPPTPPIWLAELPSGLVGATETGDGILLELDHVPHVPHPPLPQELDGWVEVAGLDDPSGYPPTLAAEGPGEGWHEAEDGSVELVRTTVPRAAAPQVVRAFAQWHPRWIQWAEQERVARPRRERHAQFTRIAREMSQRDDIFETVLGVGLFSAADGDGPRVYRHIVTAKVDVTVDRATARVTVALDADAPLRVEDRDFLGVDDGYSGERAEAVRELIASESPHPLAEACVELLDQWRSLAMDRATRFSDRWERPEAATSPPEVALAPAVILRERDRNRLIEYYDRIRASLSGPDAASPLGLAQLVVPIEEADRRTWESGGEAGGGEAGGAVLEGDPLFPLPTNQAQRDVLTRLQKDSAVVVQGPPGTGKTHTIANLISALLADGRRVLVTSQKDQALRVLREKLPEPVRDLCVLMAGAQRWGSSSGGPGGGSPELERSVNALSDRAATTNTNRIGEEIARLEEQRADLQARRSQLREEIRALREAEWYEHPAVAPGYQGTLAAIVVKVAQARPRYGWMPALPEDAPPSPPLGVEDLLRLRALLAADTPERAARRAQEIPAADAIPTAEELRDRITAERNAAENVSADDDRIADELARLDDELFTAIRRYVDAAADAVHHLGMPDDPSLWNWNDWRARALADRIAHRNDALWQRVASGAEDAAGALQALAQLGSRNVGIPHLARGDLARFQQMGTALRDWLAAGGELRQRRPRPEQRAAQELLDACTVDGRPPASAEEVHAVVVGLWAENVAAELAERWAYVGVPISAAPLLVRLSNLADQARALTHVSAFGGARDGADGLLLANRVRVPALGTPEGWVAFTRSVEATRSRIALREARHALDELDRRLPEPDHAEAPEVATLRQAARNRDAAAYTAATASLAGARDQRAQQLRCDALLAELRTAHPLLADRLERDAASTLWEERLTRVAEAWSWARAAAFCERLREAGRDRELDEALDETETRLAHITTSLAAERGWLHCLGRMRQEQRQALQSYRSHMASVGKGTGRYAARYRRAARDAMELARKAVPAWIMPLSQIVETIPPDPDAFDVVIVDEASQVGLDALFLLWLAPRVIIVGDDKQCAPSFTAVEHQKVFDRLDVYLPDMRVAFRDDFKPSTNLYELLSARFPNPVRLTEHFRCMPEIIGWSSHQFYDGRLQPLRQFGADRLEPLRVVRVEDGYTEGREANIRNPVEAKRIVETLQELLADPAYGKSTFGVIVLQATGQVRLLEDMIAATFDPAERERHDIRVGTPADFQGDERDVTLLSTVVVEPRRAVGGRLDEQRRFNVAASRAKDQMWLFTSVAPDLLHRADLRRSLMAYMREPPAAVPPMPDLGEVTADALRPPFDSLFEQRVFLRVRERGYHVIPQVPAGGRRIDLVVVGTHGRLAVECDGVLYHTSPEQVRDDLERERELRRVGWRFWRVRESEYAFDPDRALEPLWAELARRGIAPGAVEHPVGVEESPWEPIPLPQEDEEEGRIGEG